MEETKDKGIIEGKRQMIEREAAVLADTIDKRLLLQRARAAAAAAAGQPAPALSPEADETRKRLLRAEAQLAKEKSALEFKLGQEEMVARAKRLSEEREIDEAVARKAKAIVKEAAPGGLPTFGATAAAPF